MKYSMYVAVMMLSVPFLASASVVMDTGCVVLVEATGENQYQITEVTVNAQLNDDAPRLVAPEECAQTLQLRDIAAGTEILIENDSDVRSLAIAVGDATSFSLPVYNFSGTMGPNGAVPGGYYYEYSSAYQADAEETADEDTAVVEPGAEDEVATSILHSLRMELVSLLQKLVDALRGN